MGENDSSICLSLWSIIGTGKCWNRSLLLKCQKSDGWAHENGPKKDTHQGIFFRVGVLWGSSVDDDSIPWPNPSCHIADKSCHFLVFERRLARRLEHRNHPDSPSSRKNDSSICLSLWSIKAFPYGRFQHLPVPSLGRTIPAFACRQNPIPPSKFNHYDVRLVDHRRSSRRPGAF